MPPRSPAAAKSPPRGIYPQAAPSAVPAHIPAKAPPLSRMRQAESIIRKAPAMRAGLKFISEISANDIRNAQQEITEHITVRLPEKRGFSFFSMLCAV